MSQPPIRPARRADVPAICELHERTFQKPLAAASWQWKFARHATHPFPLVWVAVDDRDRPIAHYGGVPRTFRLPDASQLPAIIAFDGMTDVRFRRQGLYTHLVRSVHEAWRDAGVAGVLGLPNEQYGSRIETLDWRLLFPLRWRLRPLRPEILLASKLRLPILGRLPAASFLWNGLADSALRHHPGITVTERDEPDPAFDHFESNRATLIRGSAWVAWRYLDSHPHTYRLHVAYQATRAIGYLAWRFDRGGPRPFGLIAETAARTEAARRALLRAALTAMRASGAVAAAALAVPDTPEDRLLQRAGFAFSWGSFDVRCVPLRDDLLSEHLHADSRFEVVGGDFDVV